MPHSETASQAEVVLQGIGVAPGVAIGPVFLWQSGDDYVVERSLSEGDTFAEINRFEEALIETRRQLLEIQSSLGRELQSDKDASIFDAHLLFLNDRDLIEEVLIAIQNDRINAEAALKNVSRRYMDTLLAVEDDYLRERVADVKDVMRRMIRNLSGEIVSISDSLTDKCIVLASDLAPSDTAGLRRDTVSGFATDLGSPTSHTAVMARALEIPAVVGLHDVSKRQWTNETLLLDGTRGLLIINPTKERLDEYGHIVEEREVIRSGLSSLKNEPAETRDGHAIVLSANIESASDVKSVEQYGAEGIGLFRSEYLYLTHEDSMPSEDEQVAAYRHVAEALAPAPVIIRTLDLGGDKFASAIALPTEMNPFLGCRAIRFCLKMPNLFKTQLRAILRASSYGNVKIMYPMITQVDEILQAQELLVEAMDELEAEGIEVDRNIEVGAMIETPAAAMISDSLAKHVSFFSLGTNDLIQYTLAVDRVNELVAYLYEPTHPAILRLIKQTIDSGHKNGIWVGVCGEMAGDPVMTPLLLGLGVDELSATPSAVPLIKDSMRKVTMEDAESLARKALSSESAGDVLALARQLIREVAPEILELTD